MNRTLSLVAPAGLTDPAHPSGGNTYDLRVVAGLREHGWQVEVGTSAVPAEFVVVDGLVLTDPDPQAVALVHLPRGVEDASRRDVERDLLTGCRGVIATSAWARDWLRDTYGLAAIAVLPGVDPAPVARGGGGLLAVGAITPVKGHDVLVGALSHMPDPPPTTVVGALDLAPEHVERVQLAAAGLPVRFAGALAGPDLAAAYDAADLLVLPSRAETFGLVITEALARGIPVVAADVGGVREALGGGGVLVPPDDPEALATVLARWQGEEDDLRGGWRAAAARRRKELTGWDLTAEAFEAALNRIGAASV